LFYYLLVLKRALHFYNIHMSFLFPLCLKKICYKYTLYNILWLKTGLKSILFAILFLLLILY
jgi:hypothetical protein